MSGDDYIGDKTYLEDIQNSCPAHDFFNDSADRLREYAPPAVSGVTDPETQYTYTPDHQPEVTSLPLSSDITYTHDPSTGELSTIATPEALNTFIHDDEGGADDSECCEQCTLNECGDGHHHFASEGCDAGEDNGFVPCTPACVVVPEVVEVSIAENSACARYADGAVRCWGSSFNSSLGVDPPSSDTNIGDAPGEMPPAFAELGGPVVAMLGARGTRGDQWCAARADGAVVCWGEGTGNYYTNSGLLGPLEYSNQGSWTTVGDLPGELWERASLHPPWSNSGGRLLS